MKRKALRQSGSLKGQVVLLGLTGSIALYKSCELVRQLKEEGAEVFCLMTEGAQRFVTSLTFASLSGNPVATNLWDESLWKVAHLECAEKANLAIIAPASANCLASLSGGFAGDILSATVCATRAPILIAPAMHDRMWLHPATQANVRRLKGYGYTFVGPEYGELSTGTKGWGRLAGPETIIAAAKKVLSR
ncbi:MAG: phosphopantothenoylcysteine decarboxylase [Elusimicrobia bacterium]|nr:phosphopantothenoylcysteine decarboxylase [Elusimicrobiota bacterium]